MPKHAAPPKAPLDVRINCLVLSSFRSEFTFLQNVFRLIGLRVHYAESLDQADFQLSVTESTVLLSPRRCLRLVSLRCLCRLTANDLFDLREGDSAAQGRTE